jgi:4-amino-4-deoxychorismate lyase
VVRDNLFVNGKWLHEQPAECGADNRHEWLYDRIESFGDGLFETMLVNASGIHQYALHIARLKRGLNALAIDIAVSDIESDIATVLARLKRQESKFYRLKLRVSRGVSEAGYATANVQSSRMLSFQPFTPALPSSAALTLSSVKLPHQPLLAGIKHCNRLEQVLAKREQELSAYDDALLLDYDGHVIEAISSNVFILQGDTLITPDLSRSGVAGVMRGYIMQDAASRCDLQTQQSNLTIAQMQDSQGVFLCNALMGVRLVRSCMLDNGEQLTWQSSVKLEQLQAQVFSALCSNE